MKAHRYNPRKVIARKRGEGKTESLLKESASSGDTLICSALWEVRHLKRRARRLGLKIPTPLSYRQFMQWRENSALYPDIHNVLIDEVDRFCEWLSPAHINAVSITLSTPEKVEEE